MTLPVLEIADAIVAQIKATTLSYTLKLVQVGDLSHYPENPALSDDIPAVFVQPLTTEPWAMAGIGGEDFDEIATFRVLFVDAWTNADGNPVRKKVSRTQELVDKAAIRTSGASWQFGDTISGVTVFPSPPGTIEFAPPEHAFVAESTANETRRVYATAFTWVVTVRTAR